MESPPGLRVLDAGLFDRPVPAERVAHIMHLVVSQIAAECDYRMQFMKDGRS